MLKHDARSSSSKSSHASHPHRRTKLLLAAATGTAILVGFSQLNLLRAQPTDLLPVMAATEQQPAISNHDRLQRAISEFRNGQYEEALADLQQVKSDDLSDRDRRDLSDYMGRADDAATQRKAARAEFEQGEQSLAGNRATEATLHYQAAINNKFADEGTRAKSREQLAVAEAMMRQSGLSLRDVYNQAVTDYKGGQLESARTKFQQLQNGGYRAGLFQRSAADYLKDIDKAMAAAPQTPAPVAAQPAPAPVVAAQPEPAPAPVVVAPAPAPEPMPAQPATPPAPQPMAVQPTPAPAPTPAPVQQPAPAPVAAQPEPTPAPVVAAPVTPVEPAVDARASYRLGVQQFRSGDWIAARKSFETARSLNYRPGLFEDSPARYIARMDEKEQADAAKAAAVAQAQVAAPAPAPVDPNEAHRQAVALMEQAEAARAAGRSNEALALYNRVLDLEPNNNAAGVARNQLEAQIGAAQAVGPQPDILLQQQQINQQQREEIQFRVSDALNNAQTNIAAGKFEDAQASIENARVARTINPTIFRPEELSQFDGQIQATQTSLDQARISARVNGEALARADAEARLRADKELQSKQVQQTIADLIRNAREASDQGRYDQAVGILDQILTLDPNNEYAKLVKPLVQDRAAIQNQRQSRERYDRNVVKWYNSAEEAKIPYSDILKFPDNWPDLSAQRDQTVNRERGQRAEDAVVSAQLDRSLPEVRFDSVGFADVTEFLRDISGANIFVNWRALETAGVDKNAPVTARLRDVKFSKALETILRDVGGGAVKLGYTVDEGVITISTADDLSSNVVTNVYDIQDLIMNVTDFDQPPNFNIQSTQGGRGGGGGGGNLFGGNLNQQNQQLNQRQTLVDSVIQLIEETVAQSSWRDQGGTVGSIRELGGQLIVTQTPENQKNLSHLLEQLRETRAIQVTVEARFLTVQRNFMEEIGVDFDFVLNPSGQISDRLSPITVGNNSQAYTAVSALTTSVPGNIATELVGSSSSATGVTPNFGVTGINGGAITFLDDFQVSLLLRATQISQNTTTLTAPRLTLFNGQRAFVVVATETAYVSDLTPIVGTNAVAFDPTVGIIQSGVLLDVRATVSADRKYVTLELRPQLTRLRALVPFPVSAISNTPITTGGASQQIVQAFVQQPVRDITSINTTVSVPDGGTLLLGGQTLAGEIERDSGVPILSKIPFLKRLFTNSSMAKDEQVLLILVKPTIVIQREKEEEQFPLLGKRVSG